MRKCMAMLLAALPLVPLAAQQKFALVIGNGAYKNITALKNPVNDARDMEAALKGLGFQVETVINGSMDQMESAAVRLKNRLAAGRNAYGFLFYAGHGVQSGGENYLIPVDAAIQSASFLRQRAVSVQALLDELNEAGNALNVVVLDACRDNPFGWGRGGSRGLQVVTNQPADSIIVYATSAGSAAADGEGRNGLFTGQLLKNLRTPGLEVAGVFRLTGADVSRVSGRTQIPAVYNQFFGTAYLGSRPGTAEQAAKDALQRMDNALAGKPTQPAPAPQPAKTIPAVVPVNPMPTEKTYKIGDTGTAGGVVFYDKGFYSDGWRYMEAAPMGTEQSVYAYLKPVNGCGTAVGTGKQNTQAMLEAISDKSNPALLVMNLNYGGVKDWFLPSKDELDLMYQHLKIQDLGEFAPRSYFSSSMNGGWIWLQSFSSGVQYICGSNFISGILRACRRF